MIKEELYNRTVSILVQAYFNDTLEHGSCHACAVGNVINYYRPFSDNEKLLLAASSGERKGWSNIFCTYNAHEKSQDQEIELHRLATDSIAKSQIDSTGYTATQLAKIEYAFETAPKGNSKDEYMFNGLMVVIDTLDKIHGNTDTSINSNSKQLFIKPLQTI